MKILLLGEDGRAHAFAWKLFNSPQAIEIICAPGNGGTSQLVPRVELQPEDAGEIGRWAFNEHVDLILPSSSEPLHAGLADEAAALHISVCGPLKDSARIGQSRCYAKEFLLRHSLPTARGQAFRKLTMAERYLAAQPFPIVIKSDHPGGGSGTFADRYTALRALRDFFAARPVEGTSEGVVIEEYLPGVRICFSAFTDGHTAVPLLPVRLYDHLREGDASSFAPRIGANTGTSTYAHKLTEYLHERLIMPIVAALQQEQMPYLGILGIDCIITAQGPRITGLRSSLRDMEAQVILPRLQDDLLPIIAATTARRLHQPPPLRWRKEASIGMALVARGYPHHFPVGSTIDGLESIESGVFVFHSQTNNPFGLVYKPVAHRGPDPLAKLIMGMEGPRTTITTTGGHVLTVVALGKTLQEARQRALHNAECITFAGRSYAEDIGQREFT